MGSGLFSYSKTATLTCDLCKHCIFNYPEVPGQCYASLGVILHLAIITLLALFLVYTKVNITHRFMVLFGAMEMRYRGRSHFHK